MSRLVLDASVAVHWFLARPVPAFPAAVLRGIQAGDSAVIPFLWRLETINAILASERRRALSAEATSLALAAVEGVAALLEMAPEDSTQPSDVAGAARRHGLTVYDAVYLVLARQLALPLATLDAALRRAAPAAGVTLFQAV